MGMKQTYIDGQYMKSKYLKIRDKNVDYAPLQYGHRSTTNPAGAVSNERHIVGTFVKRFQICTLEKLVAQSSVEIMEMRLGAWK